MSESEIKAVAILLYHSYVYEILGPAYYTWMGYSFEQTRRFADFSVRVVRVAEFFFIEDESSKSPPLCCPQVKVDTD